MVQGFFKFWTLGGSAGPFPFPPSPLGGYPEALGVPHGRFLAMFDHQIDQNVVPLFSPGARGGSMGRYPLARGAEDHAEGRPPPARAIPNQR